MKFKYNYLDNRLWWKIEGGYSFEINEENHFRTNQGTYGTDSFYLGAKEWITFTINFSGANMQVTYQKGTTSYQKILDLPKVGEITFELKEEDQI